jgi:SAM-dependent methyltransferase
MSSDRDTGVEQMTIELPDGETTTLTVSTGLLRESAVMQQAAGKDGMKQWFQMKFYDDLSDIRPEKYGYYKHYVHNFVTSFFTEGVVSGKRILDFGCGPGFYSAILAQRGAHVVGIDKSPFLIQKANEHKARQGLARAEFIQADFLEFAPRWETELFDYAIAIDTLVSFDYNSQTHKHEQVVAALSSIARLLKQDGRLMIIENHPCFGKVVREIASDSGECFCIRPSGYKIEHRSKHDPHHWFTLDEMTRATSESGLAVFRIHEPDPAVALKQENANVYSFRSKYPGMIVYEICKLSHSYPQYESR